MACGDGWLDHCQPGLVQSAPASRTGGAVPQGRASRQSVYSGAAQRAYTLPDLDRLFGRQVSRHLAHARGQ